MPTGIFLVEKFVMKPVSGKIDRKCLPNLSRLLKNTKPEAEASPGDVSESARPRRDIKLPDAEPSIPPESEEVLAICRTVFEKPLGLDDGFIEAGGHSIVIARLAQQLQAAGWVVPVRTLLTTCNTARKVASQPRASKQASAVPHTVPLQSDENELCAQRSRGGGAFHWILHHPAGPFRNVVLLPRPC